MINTNDESIFFLEKIDLDELLTNPELLNQEQLIIEYAITLYEKYLARAYVQLTPSLYKYLQINQ